MKPPLIQEKIIEIQNKSENNYKGNRNTSFSCGQSVYIRDYGNPNKSSWTPAQIKKKIGPRSYTCIIAHNNREIKRHLNQIRDGGGASPLRRADTSGENTMNVHETETACSSSDPVSASESRPHCDEDTSTKRKRNKKVVEQSDRELRERIDGQVVIPIKEKKKLPEMDFD